MLAFGLASLGASAFLFWVMMQGDNFITSTNWADAIQQVIEAMKKWLQPGQQSINLGATESKPSGPQAA